MSFFFHPGNILGWNWFSQAYELSEKNVLNAKLVSIFIPFLCFHFLSLSRFLPVEWWKMAWAGQIIVWINQPWFLHFLLKREKFTIILLCSYNQRWLLDSVTSAPFWKGSPAEYHTFFPQYIKQGKVPIRIIPNCGHALGLWVGSFTCWHSCPQLDHILTLLENSIPN